MLSTDKNLRDVAVHTLVGNMIGLWFHIHAEKKKKVKKAINTRVKCKVLNVIFTFCQ